MRLGDAVERALALVGVTEDRVTRWLGRSCGGCKRRQEKLNDLGRWAARVLRGKTDNTNAKDHLEGLIHED